MAISETFWAKVLFVDFIKHYLRMTPEERNNDIDQSIDALLAHSSEGNSFGAKMVQWASTYQAIQSDNGKKGGRPRKQSENIPTPTAKVTTTQKATQPVQSPAPVENPWGSEQNVMITQAQFNELAQLCGNVNKAKQMVEDLSNKIASDPKFVSVNHFATLKYWASFQKQKETKAEQPRETFETRNMRAVERAIALIDDPTYKYPWETDEEQQARVCKKR